MSLKTRQQFVKQREAHIRRQMQNLRPGSQSYNAYALQLQQLKSRGKKVGVDVEVSSQEASVRPEKVDLRKRKYERLPDNVKEMVRKGYTATKDSQGRWTVAKDPKSLEAQREREYQRSVREQVKWEQISRNSRKLQQDFVQVPTGESGVAASRDYEGMQWVRLSSPEGQRIQTAGAMQGSMSPLQREMATTRYQTVPQDRSHIQKPGSYSEFLVGSHTQLSEYKPKSKVQKVTESIKEKQLGATASVFEFGKWITHPGVQLMNAGAQRLKLPQRMREEAGKLYASGKEDFSRGLGLTPSPMYVAGKKEDAYDYQRYQKRQGDAVGLPVVHRIVKTSSGIFKSFGALGADAAAFGMEKPFITAGIVGAALFTPAKFVLPVQVGTTAVSVYSQPDLIGKVYVGIRDVAALGTVFAVGKLGQVANIKYTKWRSGKITRSHSGELVTTEQAQQWLPAQWNKDVSIELRGRPLESFAARKDVKVTSGGSVSSGEARLNFGKLEVIDPNAPRSKYLRISGVEESSVFAGQRANIASTKDSRALIRPRELTSPTGKAWSKRKEFSNVVEREKFVKDLQDSRFHVRGRSGTVDVFSQEVSPMQIRISQRGVSGQKSSIPISMRKKTVGGFSSAKAPKAGKVEINIPDPADTSIPPDRLTSGKIPKALAGKETRITKFRGGQKTDIYKFDRADIVIRAQERFGMSRTGLGAPVVSTIIKPFRGATQTDFERGRKRALWESRLKEKQWIKRTKYFKVDREIPSGRGDISTNMELTDKEYYKKLRRIAPRKITKEQEGRGMFAFRTFSDTARAEKDAMQFAVSGKTRKKRVIRLAEDHQKKKKDSESEQFTTSSGGRQEQILIKPQYARAKAKQKRRTKQERKSKERKSKYKSGRQFSSGQYKEYDLAQSQHMRVGKYNVEYEQVMPRERAFQRKHFSRQSQRFMRPKQEFRTNTRMKSSQQLRSGLVPLSDTKMGMGVAQERAALQSQARSTTLSRAQARALGLSSAQASRQAWVTKTLRLAQSSRSTSDIMWRSSSVRSPPRPKIVEPPPPPPVGPPLRRKKFPEKKKSSSRQRSFRLRSGYAPSLEALLFNVKGKKSGVGGIGLRPIVKRGGKV